MFASVSSKVDFPSMEEAILRFWQENRVFEKSLDRTRSGREFSFYDGPPFATGLPHYGHLLAGTIKDIVPRYWTMRGHYVERRFGWDCHGLPVEYEVEQDLHVSGKREIEKLGVSVFNDNCRGIVLRYTREWRDIVTRMGRWVDFDNDYKTMDPSYMESIWWVFKTLWDQDLVYEGHKILPYCPRCSTPLSNFETNQGYEEVTDPAITVRFRIKGAENTYILAWTTTPWTLPSNMALAVGEEIPYVEVKDGKDTYFLARDRLSVYYKSDSEYNLRRELVGSEMVGMEYEPLFPFFREKRNEGAFRVVTADFVTVEDGTGIVHIAPGFGEDDCRIGREQNIPAVCPVDEEGRFTAEVTDYAGRQVKEADKDIIRRLKTDGAIIHHSTIRHSYPHCWRCDTALIYRAVSTWFVRVERIRDRIVSANSGVHWVPEHLRDGRFGKWLEQARDWAVSRNRYWGTPLPLWRSDDGNEIRCVGSIGELEELSNVRVEDLHKHVVDAIEIPSGQGKGMLKRVPEVLDCWFESGAMPYAQAHYPFENKDRFEANFPADFIAEGLDQTRGWFYTLMVLSTALFDKAAFKNVVVNGLVLAEDGRKMSKRLKNYPDPVYMVNSYGADALRLYMINSPVVKAEDLRFSESGVTRVYRELLLPLWNAYGFFVTYANTDSWTPAQCSGKKSPNVLDRWILSSLEALTLEVVDAMDVYDLQRAVKPFVKFIDNLTNWYIRRSRRRFWKSQNDDDKAHAYETLWRILLRVCKIAAPFIPFVTDEMYRNLRTDDMPESVHLCEFPTGDEQARDDLLENEMDAAITVVQLGRLLRTESNLKVRQPLAAMHIVSRDSTTVKALKDMQNVILEELNIKKAILETSEEGLATVALKPNYRTLGPKFGSDVGKVVKALMSVDGTGLDFSSGMPLTVAVDGKNVKLQADDVLIEHVPLPDMVVASDAGLVVGLETSLTEPLVQEGLARELVNKIQKMRKTADLEVTQRINLRIAADTDLSKAVKAHLDYVKAETLCLELRFVDEPADGSETWDVNGHSCAMLLVVA